MGKLFKPGDVVSGTGGDFVQYDLNLSGGLTEYLQLLRGQGEVYVTLKDHAGTMVFDDYLSQGQTAAFTPRVDGTYTLTAQSDSPFKLTGGDTQVAVYDNKTGVSSRPFMAAYEGPVAGLEHEYIALDHHSLCITATAPNVFLHGTDCDDALAVTSGDNVLDGGRGSNFLTGGSGHDNFFLDCRDPDASIWSTLVNFGKGDSVTMWGITQDNCVLTMEECNGASGYQGVTLKIHREGSQQDCGLTLAGYGSNYLNGCAVAYGRSGDLPGLPGSDFLTITAT